MKTCYVDFQYWNQNSHRFQVIPYELIWFTFYSPLLQLMIRMHLLKHKKVTSISDKIW